MSLQSDSYLTLPLERDDTKTTGMTLSMNVKPGGKDGPIALVNTEESVSSNYLELSYKNELMLRMSRGYFSVLDGICL